MHTLLSHALIFCLALAGFTALALAMERHQEDFFNRLLKPTTTKALRISGWCSLLLCLLAAVRLMDWNFGLVAFSGHTGAAAATVFITMAGLVQMKNRRSR